MVTKRDVATDTADRNICVRYYRSGNVKERKIKVVPPFSIQSYQRDVIVEPPPKNFPKICEIGNTLFRMYYDRGDVPVCLDYHSENKIRWKVDVESLDFRHYLPIFFDGLRELQHPYKILVREGITEMLAAGKSKVPPVIPHIIIPIKTALNTRNIDIICCTMKIIQKLVACGEMIGESLVPYYRQILPIFNVYATVNVNCGDQVDYGQRLQLNAGDTVQETLQILEQYGGKDSFINIKYMIPTYESSVIR